MALDRFDDDIKKLLEDHIEEYDSSSWDRLSSSLDNEEIDSTESISDEKVETMVKDKLQNLQTPLNEDHWQKLKLELDQLDARKERLWTIKLIEATILLLLLFTYWNFAGYPHYAPIDSEDPIEILALSNHQISDVNKVDFQNENQNIQGVSLYADDISVKGLNKNDSRTKSELVNYSPLKENLKDLPYLASNTDLDIRNSLFNSSLRIIENDSKKNETLDVIPLISALSISSLSNVSDRPVLVNERTEQSKALIEDLKESKSQNGFWLTIGFAKDVNLINSSVNIQTLGSYLNSGLYGTSASILGSYQIKNVEIESGISFSEKNYAPGLIRSFSKASPDTYLETQLDDIRFKQIQIPVIAKFHAFNRTRSNLYVLAGLGFNVITDYAFNTVKTVQPTSRVATLVDVNSNDLTNLPYGITEGGPIRDNYYTTAIVGFGFQTLMKNNTAVFFQPQYQFTISEGANDFIRKVHSFNIAAGVRFKF